ncbi:MAG: YdeI/OmpD-associated family protein [Bacteroidetes bacterium]|nr:YdeI/OmpD-associated family protein [Bacteroidota bacterium]
MATDYPFYHPLTRKQWRQWLQKNHVTAAGVWLVYHKKETGKPRVSYDEAVEEALCFGWIDSLPRKLEDGKAALKFTPRKPKSVWSKLNKTRIAQLIEKELMTPAGLEKIEQAKKNGSWDTLTPSDNLAATNTLPPDLQKALMRNKKAHAHFTAFSMSIRKQFLSWIDSAKRPETRTARIEMTVQMADANKKPGLKGFKL